MDFNATPQSLSLPSACLRVWGARTHNLKNIDVRVPRHQLVVITGLSGSGKSSLAFDTLFAEGHRLYTESLSTYVRQFLAKVDKPDVNRVEGMVPAIAIQQRMRPQSPRSTVGTLTEVHEYLKLLYAKVGVTYDPKTGLPVVRDDPQDVANYVMALPSGTPVSLLAPLQLPNAALKIHWLESILHQGFYRLLQNGHMFSIEELLGAPDRGEVDWSQPVWTVVDRVVVRAENAQLMRRIIDAAQNAFSMGGGTCAVEGVGGQRRVFSKQLERDGVAFEEPSVGLFNFNTPYGACGRCEGFGQTLCIDANKVIPNPNLSVQDGAVLPWRSVAMQHWLEPLLEMGADGRFPIDTPYKRLSEAQRQCVWNGNGTFKGIHSFFAYLQSRSHKIHYRVLMARYRGQVLCPDCSGTRLRKEANYVRIADRSLGSLLLSPLQEAHDFLTRLTLTDHQRAIAGSVLEELQTRLRHLMDVGLGYLSLNRRSNTLSGGEYQRARLAASLGSPLVGALYVLDEPTVGLHPRDTQRLVQILKALRDKGSTVLVVEHEEQVVRQADWIIELGPDAGEQGGQIVFEGTFADLQKNDIVHTARCLNDLDGVSIPSYNRAGQGSIQFFGARAHNLKDIDVTLPLNALTVVTGVSGSGKSSLVRDVIYNTLSTKTVSAEKLEALQGDVDQIHAVDFIDQAAMNRSSRSTPLTYTKAYDAVRELFAAQPLAQQRCYKAGQFSFNTPGGRCEVCQGQGVNVIDMQFMSDVVLCCQACGGKRFQAAWLEVTYKDKNIADVLNMTVEEGTYFFSDHAAISCKLQMLGQVGLGYLRMGQPFSTLSGGEAQRVKLAYYIEEGRQDQGQKLLIFDEPTSGLHAHDVKKLLQALHKLVEVGHTVLVVEHNLDVIRSADWVVDLGPEGGPEGGRVVFYGTPSMLTDASDSITARYLQPKLYQKSSL